MPYANNGGVSIYYEVEGNGPALVLQHGIAGDLTSWRESGYVAVLRGSYQCILIDARGHGRSDKPSDVASYGLDKSYSDVVSVLDALGIDSSTYWGYSMGGAIGLVGAKAADGRLHGVVIGGAAPGPRSEASLENSRRMMQRLEQGTEAFLDILPPQVRAAFQNIDSQALAVAMRAFLERPIEPGLISPPMPCLVYNGGSDLTVPNAEAAKATAPANVRYEQIGDLNHMQCLQRSDLVLPVVLPFLEEVTRAAAVG